MSGGRNPISIGEKFGTLTVLERLPIPKGKIYYQLRCRCDCGLEVTVWAGKFRQGARCPVCSGKPIATRRPRLRPGDAFGTRVIVARSGGTSKHPRFLVRCQCGEEQEVAGGSIGSKKCMKCRRWGQPIKYSGVRTAEYALYRSWTGMRYRCSAVDDVRCRAWAGRGIKVCSEWDQDFKAFEKWSLANGWRKGLSLDRIDVDGDYGPDNCEWVTRGENSKRARATYVSVRRSVDPFGPDSYLPIEAMFGGC